MSDRVLYRDGGRGRSRQRGARATMRRCSRHAPAAIAALPRFPLLQGPSPLQRLERFSAALGGGVEVWVKREDLLPLAFGGNKLRNLEFLVGAALAEGADTLVTSGRRWSNHCRLDGRGRGEGRTRRPSRPQRPAGRAGRARTSDSTSCWARPSTSRRRTSVPSGPRSSTGSSRICDGGRRPYVVAVGGTGPVGAAGQVLAGSRGSLAARRRRGRARHDRPAFRDRRDPRGPARRSRGSPAAGAEVVGIAVAAPARELRPTIADC